MEFLAGLHPKVVHFPIALLLISVLFELIGTLWKNDFFSKAAHLLLFFGVIGSFLAALTGNQAFTAYEYWNESSRELVNTHQTFANITIWFFTGLLVVRTYLVVKKKHFRFIKYMILVLSILGCYFIYQTAVHGGDLVYKYGIGVNLKFNQTEKYD
jgi:uncharacterized membrane protein